jgi:predicted Zn-dependent protease
MSEEGPLEIELRDVTLNPEYKGDPQGLVWKLADTIIRETGAGFAIVGSPLTFVRGGEVYSNAIGISINNGTALSKSGLATTLRNLADELSSDIDKIENFLKEARPNG